MTATLADEQIQHMRGSNDPADAMLVLGELLARGYSITITAAGETVTAAGETVTAAAKRRRESHRASAKSATRAVFNLAYEIVRCASV